jgi:hypothetical protein
MKRNPDHRRTAPAVFRFLLLAGFVLSGFPCRGQDANGDVQVLLESNVSLRALADRYLGGPDDWEIILRYNGLSSPDALKTGQRLRIPVALYRKTRRTLDEAQMLIASANAEGAGLLAPAGLERAQDRLASALDLKKRGDLDGAGAEAAGAARLAGDALAESRSKRILSVTAVLKEKQGSVQRRPAEEVQWSEVPVLQEFVEKDRVRTLSKSYGSIQFIDGSRVRMDENALIVIESARKDVVKNTSTADILVLEGDVSALIQSLASTDPIRIKSPGVATRIRSRHFLASRDAEQTARFSNYEGEMDVISAGASVTLSTNEGTAVRPGRMPDTPKKLPDAPALLAPAEGESSFGDSLEFRWTPSEGAASYRLEISRDRSFGVLEKYLAVGHVRSATWKSPPSGTFFWRIRAGDADRLQGPFSQPRAFTVRPDRLPPFLEVYSPASDTVVTADTLRIRCRTERGASVTVNGIPADVFEPGTAAATVRLVSGAQRVSVAAVDSAGNRSEAGRTVVSAGDREGLMLRLSPPPFSNAGRIEIAGRVRPAARVWINDNPVTVRGDSFTVALTLAAGTHAISIRTETPDGKAQTREFRTVMDMSPPEIRVTTPPPFTDRPTLELEGSVSEPAEVTVNQRPVRADSGRFVIPLELAEGSNDFLVRARDRAGNLAEQLFVVNRDTRAPVIESVALSPDRVRGGELVGVRVRASDKGIGTARTATFLLVVAPGGTQIPGLLRLNPESGAYEGNAAIPRACAGSLRVKNLYVSDYLGNTAIYP